MQASELLRELRGRGVALYPTTQGIRYEAPRGALTPDLRAKVAAHRPELIRLLILDQIEATLRPGEWIAYRDRGQLLTSKFAGTSRAGGVSLWLADGAIRLVPPESIALDWCSDAVEMFEERLAMMLAAEVPEETARVRAEQCTLEHLQALGDRWDGPEVRGL